MAAVYESKILLALALLSSTSILHNHTVLCPPIELWDHVLPVVGAVVGLADKNGVEQLEYIFNMFSGTLDLTEIFKRNGDGECAGSLDAAKGELTLSNQVVAEIVTQWNSIEIELESEVDPADGMRCGHEKVTMLMGEFAVKLAESAIIHRRQQLQRQDGERGE